MYLHEAITRNLERIPKTATGALEVDHFSGNFSVGLLEFHLSFRTNSLRTFDVIERVQKCSCRLLVSVINMVIHLPQTLQLSLQLANMNSEFLSQSPLCCHVVHLESSSLQPNCSHKSKNTETFVYFTIRFNSLLRL